MTDQLPKRFRGQALRDLQASEPREGYEPVPDPTIGEPPSRATVSRIKGLLPRLADSPADLPAHVTSGGVW
jgi:hypothetical protein